MFFIGTLQKKWSRILRMNMNFKGWQKYQIIKLYMISISIPNNTKIRKHVSVLPKIIMLIKCCPIERFFLYLIKFHIFILITYHNTLLNHSCLSMCTNSCRRYIEEAFTGCWSHYNRWSKCHIGNHWLGKHVSCTMYQGC